MSWQLWVATGLAIWLFWGIVGYVILWYDPQAVRRPLRIVLAGPLMFWWLLMQKKK